MADINIYGTLKSQTGDGKLAKAAQIYDDALGKFQSEINQEGGSSAAYETIDIGEQTNFSGDYPNGQYTISYSGSSLYDDINSIWNQGRIPVLEVLLQYHTSAYSIPLYKAPNNDFGGHERAENGNYTIDVQIYSSQQRIITRSVGTYTKPSGGIPKTDLAQAVQDTLDKAENLDTELDETSTNAVQNKVITKELNDNYAKKDGFYESMGVGTAVNLAGQELRNNDSLYRTSGGTEDIATGTARIEAIQGNTIAWNQLCEITRSSSAVLVKDDMDTKFDTYKVKANPASNTTRCLSIYGNTNIQYDHKVLFVLVFKSNFTNKPYLRYIDGNGGNVGMIGDNIYTKDAWNTYMRISNGITASTSSGLMIQTAYVEGEYISLPKNGGFYVFDLTLIYGAGNEPSTPEQFEADYQKWFGKPLTYEPYDEGSLKNVQLSGLKTIGFNQWDGILEKGRISDVDGSNVSSSYYQRSKYIKVLPNTTYYYKSITTAAWNDRFAYYDSQKNFIKFSLYVKNTTFTTPSTCAFIRLQVNANNQSETDHTDIGCINLSWSGVKNGTYEPYEENTISIPTTTMTGKLNGEGESVVIFPDGMNIFDSLYYVGGKTYGIVDGTTRVYQEGDVTSATMITDGRAYTHVKLAEPLVYEVDDFTLPARYKVNDWGTEEQLQASGANGIAAIISCLYGVNAVDILRNLPKNYISTESMDNFLAALGAAMGGTWTKTWNDNDGEYNFSFTANALTNSLTSNQENI